MSSTRSRQCRSAAPSRAGRARPVVGDGVGGDVSPQPPTCHDRYDRAVAELRSGRVRASLATLDALVRAGAATTTRSWPRRTFCACRRCSCWTAIGTPPTPPRAPRATGPPTGPPTARRRPILRRAARPSPRTARALAAADRVLASSASTRLAHGTSSHLAAGRHGSCLLDRHVDHRHVPRAAHLYTSAPAPPSSWTSTRARATPAARRARPGRPGRRRRVSHPRRRTQTMRSNTTSATRCRRRRARLPARRSGRPRVARRLRADLALVRLADAADVAETRPRRGQRAHGRSRVRDADVETRPRGRTRVCPRVASRAARTIARVEVDVEGARREGRGDGGGATERDATCAAPLDDDVPDEFCCFDRVVDGGNAAVAASSTRGSTGDGRGCCAGWWTPRTRTPQPRDAP